VRVFQVDAFTHQTFAGNPAGVVLDAQLLTDAEMQAMARELGTGDTAFVLPADAADHDLRVRFFTPRTEVGFVGHATLAVHAVLGSLGQDGHRRQKQRSGTVEIDRQAGAQGPQWVFTQAAPPLRSVIEERLLAQILAALGLGADVLAPDCPPVIAGAGSARALLGLRTGASLANLQPDLGRLAALTGAGAPPGFFLYTLHPVPSDCQTEARMFCPALGIPEDPVSGNAHAMLGALLCQRGLLAVNDGVARFTGRQGHHLGRPGTVQVSIEVTDGKAARVAIGGAATIVYATTIELSGSGP
jgi:PhzF family phenazine biosynthesis protein